MRIRTTRLRQLATISAPTIAIVCGLTGSARLLPSTEADSFIDARLLRVGKHAVCDSANTAVQGILMGGANQEHEQ